MSGTLLRKMALYAISSLQENVHFQDHTLSCLVLVPKYFCHHEGYMNTRHKRIIYINYIIASKEEKSFGFCVFVYILCVFVYILCVLVYVFIGSQSQGSYISRDFVVDL